MNICRPHFRPPLLALSLLAPLAGCGNEVRLLMPVFLEAHIAGGQHQADTVFSTLAQPLRVQVRDQDGKPYSGVKILWDQGAPGSGTLSATETTTGADGAAQVWFTFGQSAGPYTIHARVAGAQVASRLVFEATAQPGRPATLIWLRGGGGWARAGQVVEEPYTVRVTDRHGNPSPGATVQWLVTAGSGQVESHDPPLAGTDFEVSHRLGPEQGPQTVVAVGEGLPDGPQIAFSVTAVGLVVYAELPNYWTCYYEGECDSRFAPANVVIPPGSVVAWVMPSADRCDVTFEDNPSPPASGLLQFEGAFHLRSFPVPGVYRYRCTTQSTDFTKGMVGIVTVGMAGSGP